MIIEDKLQALKETRDTHLPKLLSGESDVPKIEIKDHLS